MPRGSHKCPQDPSFSCNDDQTCCKLPKGEVPVFIHLCSLYSEVFFTKLFFVLLLSIRIKIIFIIIIPSHAGSWLLPLQGRHLLQRSNSLLSTWWGKDFHLLQHCIDLIRLLHWDVVWIFDRSCKQDFMKAFNDT